MGKLITFVPKSTDTEFNIEPCQIISMDSIRNYVTKRSANTEESNQYDIPLIIQSPISQSDGESLSELFIYKDLDGQITIWDHTGLSWNELLHETHRAMPYDVDLETVLYTLIITICPEYIFFAGPFNLEMLTTLHRSFDVRPFIVEDDFI